MIIRGELEQQELRFAALANLLHKMVDVMPTVLL